MAKKAKKATKRKAREAHPEDELRRVQQAVQGGLAPAFVLRGEERYFRERGTRAIVAAAAERGLEVCSHDTQDPDFAPARLLDDLSGGALFASARCIVVVGADKLLKKGARGYLADFAGRVVARLATPDEGTIVLCAESLRADNAVVKAVVAAGGELVGCRKLWDSPPPWDPDPRRAELVQWLLDRARRTDVPLSPEDAVYVVAATGGDLFELENQLARIGTAGPGNAGGVRANVTWQAGGSPFAIAESLLQGDAARATAGLESLFAGGFQGRDGSRTLDRTGLVTILMSALTSKARESFAGAVALAGGAGPDEAVQIARVRGGPRALADFKARVGRRSAADWQGLLRDLTRLERLTRTGTMVDATDFAALALSWRVRAQRARTT